MHGVHGLIDSKEYPALTCHYNGAFQLTKVVVRAPIVYARNTGPGTQQRRWAGASASNGPRVSASERQDHLHRQGLRDRQSAGGLHQALVIVLGRARDRYRVRVDMFWYDSQGNQIGKATHVPDWYGFVVTRTAADIAHGIRGELGRLILASGAARSLTSAGGDPAPRRRGPCPDARGR